MYSMFTLSIYIHREMHSMTIPIRMYVYIYIYIYTYIHIHHVCLHACTRMYVRSTY